jgi:hypothetical protein
MEPSYFLTKKFLKPKTGWNLWLDDFRPTDYFIDPDVYLSYPEFGIYYYNNWQPGDFKWAKSSNQAISLIKFYGPPKAMALDHDLGGDDTSIIFLKWLSENHFSKIPIFNIHSSNFEGARNIEAFMKNWDRLLNNYK